MLNYVRNLGIYDWCFVIDVDEYITITENDITLEEYYSTKKMH